MFVSYCFILTLLLNAYKIYTIVASSTRSFCVPLKIRALVIYECLSYPAYNMFFPVCVTLRKYCNLFSLFIALIAGVMLVTASFINRWLKLRRSLCAVEWLPIEVKRSLRRGNKEILSGRTGISPGGCLYEVRGKRQVSGKTYYSHR